MSSVEQLTFSIALTRRLSEIGLKADEANLEAGTRVLSDLHCGADLDTKRVCAAYAGLYTNLFHLQNGRAAATDHALRVRLAALTALNDAAPRQGLDERAFVRFQQSLAKLASGRVPTPVTLMGDAPPVFPSPHPTSERERLLSARVDAVLAIFFIKQLPMEWVDELGPHVILALCDRVCDEQGAPTLYKIMRAMHEDHKAVLKAIEAHVNGEPVTVDLEKMSIHYHAYGALCPESPRLRYALGEAIEALKALERKAVATVAQLPAPKIPPPGVKAVMDQMKKNPELAQFITMRWQDGRLEITAKSHEPNAAKTLVNNAGAYFKGLFNFFPRAAWQLLTGQEDGFDKSVAVFSAECTHLLGAKILVDGLENMDPDKKYIVAPRHFSYFDILVNYLVLNPLSLGYAAKWQLLFLPVVGQVLLLSNRFTILRRSKSGATKDRNALDAVAHQIVKPDNQFSPTIFPEGTRRDPASPVALKKGFAHVAMQTVTLGRPVSVLPVHLSGTSVAWPKRGLHVKNQTVYVNVGRPLDPVQFVNDPKPVDGLVAATTAFFEANRDRTHLTKYAEARHPALQAQAHQPPAFALYARNGWGARYGASISSTWATAAKITSRHLMRR